MERYECDQCRACCKGSLIIEADDLDVMREPRLIDAHHRGKPVHQVVYEIQHDFKTVYLAGGSPCAFLNPDNRCSIYPTRPNCCVGMEAGDEQCQAARGMEGLLPVMPASEFPGESC